MTIPAKSIMGLVTPAGTILAVIAGMALLIFALRFWNFALRKYSSASS